MKKDLAELVTDHLTSEELTQGFMHVPVPKERYAELLRAEKKLNALEAAGVDNWEGYDEAMSQS
jgi:hypothetical protein